MILLATVRWAPIRQASETAATPAGRRALPLSPAGVVRFMAGGDSVQQIASHAADPFNPFQATPMALTVSFGTFGYDSGFDRQWAGLVATGSASLFSFPSPSFTLA